MRGSFIVFVANDENAPSEFVKKRWPWLKPKGRNDKDLCIIDRQFEFLREQPENCLTNEGRAEKECKAARAHGS